MCPGIAVLGGGGSGGDGDGDGNGGKDGSAGDGKGKGGNGSGDGKTGGEGCGDPVCPITGRMFLDVLDFAFTGPLPLRWIRHYNSRQCELAGELGHGWSHDYGWRIRDARRRQTELFDDQNRLQEFPKIPDTAAGVGNALGWTLRRDGRGFSLLTPDQIRRDFGAVRADGFHHVEAETDRNGNTIRIERDASGAMTGLVDSAGRPYRVEIDDQRRITRISVAVEPTHQQWMEVVRYTYDDDGDLIGCCDAEGFRWGHVYSGHLMTEHRTPTGLTYCYRYDGATQNAWCVESWGEYLGSIDPALETPIPPRPTGIDRRPVKGINHVRFDYLKQTRYTEVTSGLGGVLRYFGDENGRVIKRVDAAGGISEYLYDPETGALVGETQPDGSSRVPSTSSPPGEGFVSSSGATVASFLDERGLEVTFQEDFQSVVRRAFDPRGNLTLVLHADGTTEEYSSDDRGLLLQSIDRLGVVTRYVHDAMGNLIERERSGAGAETMAYDYLGRKIAHADRLGARTEWTWDRRNEVIEKRHADGGFTRWVRDGLRHATLSDHNGQISRVLYGGLHWPIRIEEPDGSALEYRYDVEGHVVAIRNGRGEVFRQTHDHTGRLAAVQTFEGLRYSYGYDVTGKLLWQRGPLGTETREYDEQGRLATVELPDETIALSYDRAARTFAIDNGTLIARVVDAASNPIRETDGRHQLEIHWHGGEADGFVSDVGLPVRRTRGKTGQVDTIEAGDVAVIHLELPARDGQLIHLGDGLVLRRTFTSTGQLEGQWLARRDDALPREQQATPADPGLLWWTTYTWRGDFLVREHDSNDRTVEYDLTPGGRIRARRAFAGGQLVDEELLSFDGFGTPIVKGARYDAHGRPTEIHGAVIEYDDAGRMCRRGDRKLRWSAAGELLEVESPHQIVRFRYDARGRRVAKRVYRQNEIVRDVSYQWMNDCVLHEVDHSAQRTRTYLRDAQSYSPIALVDLHGAAVEVAYLLRSPIGYPVGAVDPAGNVVWQAAPTIYGEARPTVATMPVDVRFPNQHADADVGLVYNHRRWFDPETGLFISPDPLLLEGNIHPREYVRNPTIECDPEGLVPIINGVDHGPTATGLLAPGPNATRGTAAVPGYIDAGNYATKRGFNQDVRRAIDNAGFKHGCHSCGSTDPDPTGVYGYKHFVPDHQAPVSASKATGATPPAGSTRLYPHCHRCSNAQKYQQATLARNPTANAASAVSRQNANLASGTPHPMPSTAAMTAQSTIIKNNAAAPPNNGWPNGY
jgi:RHS repeat-associated protein